MATPGQEGPSSAPPPLPEGWIAQWDGQSKKYYFVNMSTGVSQWEIPTHAAPTTTTYQDDHQRSLSHQNSQNLGHGNYTQASDGKGEQGSGDRGLGGNIGQFAMNQLLGGGKKQSKTSSGGPLGAIAGQLLGGAGHGSAGHGGAGGHSKTSASSITGSLVSSFLGGKQPDKASNHSSPHPPQPNHGGLMNTVGSLFGKNEKPINNFGYSQTSGNQPGSYSGSVPPNSYQPSNTGVSHQQANYSPQQHSYHAHDHQIHSYAPQNAPPNNYGNSYNPPPPQGQHQQPHYNQFAKPIDNQNSSIQHHNSGQYQGTSDYGQALPPYQQSSFSYTGSSHNNKPPYSAGYPQGGPQNQQWGQNNGYDSYGNSGGPPLPTGSHPNNPYQGSQGPQGRY